MYRIRSILSVLLSILVGVGHDPRVVAAFRALVLLVVGALLDAGVAYIQGPGAAVPGAAIIYVLLRYAEGVFDKYRVDKAAAEYNRIMAEVNAKYPPTPAQVPLPPNQAITGIDPYRAKPEEPAAGPMPTEANSKVPGAA